MAILSNVNGKFAVDSTGAIQFSGQTGTSGYVLKSNGNAAPTWVDASTVIGGPYLPLTGGTLTGNLAINGSNSLTVGGTLSGSTATFTGLVSGITPTAAANFATKAYVDAHPGANTTWPNVGAGTRTTLDLVFKPPTSNYAGFQFLTAAGAGAGYLLIRGTSNAGQIYKAEGITLVSDSSWVTIASRTTTDAGVRLMSGATSAERLVCFDNGNSYFPGELGIGTPSPNYKLHVSGTGGADTLLRLENTTTNKYPHISLKALGAEYHIGVGGTGTATGYVNNLYFYDINNSAPRITLTQAGNVGIGTQSPGSKLTVSGPSTAASNTASQAIVDILGSSTARLLMGTASASPYGAWINSDATGQPLVLQGPGGNVGIGTDSPSYPLDVTGAIRSSSGIYLNNASGGFLWNQANASIAFGTNNTERMRIWPAGMLQIGDDVTATPELLTLQAYTQNEAFSGKYSAAGYLWFLRNETGPSGRFQLMNVGNTTINLEGNTTRDNYILGDLGIGTTSPSVKLEVEGSTNAIIKMNSTAGTGGRMDFAHGGTNYGNVGSARNILGIGNASDMMVNGGSVLYLGVGAQTITVTSGHKVGIGVTGPTEKLEISGKVKINSPNAPNSFAELNIGWTSGGETRAIDIDGNWTGNENKSITFTHGSAATNIVGQINCQHTGPGSRIRWGKLYHSNDSSTYTMELISSSSTTADLTVLGNITASADVVAYSDERLKSNIKTLDGSKVLKMRGVSFEKEGKKGSGVIAQELEKIAPELVNNDNEYKGVAYGNLTGYLIEAIKQLEARVKELENK